MNGGFRWAQVSQIQGRYAIDLLPKIGESMPLAVWRLKRFQIVD
jgi:hypothetical protein